MKKHRLYRVGQLGLLALGVLICGVVSIQGLRGAPKDPTFRANRTGPAAPLPPQLAATNAPATAKPAQPSTTVGPEPPAPPKPYRGAQQQAIREILRLRQLSGGSVLSGTSLDSVEGGEAFVAELAELSVETPPPPVTETIAPPPLPRVSNDAALIESLRESCRLLDDKANRLERRRSYDLADSLRSTAAELRTLARAIDREQTTGQTAYPPVQPTPHWPASQWRPSPSGPISPPTPDLYQAGPRPTPVPPMPVPPTPVQPSPQWQPNIPSGAIPPFVPTPKPYLAPPKLYVDPAPAPQTPEPAHDPPSQPVVPDDPVTDQEPPIENQPASSKGPAGQPEPMIQPEPPNQKVDLRR